MRGLDGLYVQKRKCWTKRTFFWNLKGAAEIENYLKIGKLLSCMRKMRVERNGAIT